MRLRSPRCRIKALITAACVVASGLIAYDTSRDPLADLATPETVPAAALRTPPPTPPYAVNAYPDPTGYGVAGDLATAEVILVGDSLANGCRDQIRDALATAGVTSAIGYWSGRPTHNGVTWALSLSRKPPVLVMELGTNDWSDPSVMPAQIDRLLAGLEGHDVRVLWVDTYNGNKLLATGWINQGIWSKHGEPDDPEAVTVVPWYSWFAKKPTRDAYYLRDKVHPSVPPGPGCAFMADVIKGPIVAAAS